MLRKQRSPTNYCLKKVPNLKVIWKLKQKYIFTKTSNLKERKRKGKKKGNEEGRREKNLEVRKRNWRTKHYTHICEDREEKKGIKNKTKNNRLQKGLGLVGADERHSFHRSYSCKGISPTQNTRAADSDIKEASEEKHMVKTEFFIKINSHNYKCKVFH